MALTQQVVVCVARLFKIFFDVFLSPILQLLQVVVIQFCMRQDVIDFQLTFGNVNKLTISAVNVIKNACLTWASVEENEKMDQIKCMYSYLVQYCL